MLVYQSTIPKITFYQLRGDWYWKPCEISHNLVCQFERRHLITQKVLRNHDIQSNLEKNTSQFVVSTVHGDGLIALVTGTFVGWFTIHGTSTSMVGIIAAFNTGDALEFFRTGYHYMSRCQLISVDLDVHTYIHGFYLINWCDFSATYDSRMWPETFEYHQLAFCQIKKFVYYKR